MREEKREEREHKAVLGLFEFYCHFGIPPLVVWVCVEVKKRWRGREKERW